MTPDFFPTGRLPRAPGTTQLRSREPWLVEAFERPLWMGEGVLRVLLGCKYEVMNETAFVGRVTCPTVVLYTPGTPFEVEPWQVAVYGRKLAPEQVMRFYVEHLGFLREQAARGAKLQKWFEAHRVFLPEDMHVFPRDGEKR